jgi:hypothetical protein
VSDTDRPAAGEGAADGRDALGTVRPRCRRSD